MATRSIYHKDCPACAASVGADTKRCDCGYSFETQMQENQSLPEDQAVQDEELLREYLDARIGQAVGELQTIQAGMAHDSRDLDKANQVLRAFAILRELRDELKTQTAKIADAKKIARAARLERGMPVDAEDDADATATSQAPTDAFRAAQAAKAEMAMKAAGIDAKECPKCHTILPQPAVHCFCGYNFVRPSSGLPTDTHTTASRLVHRKTI